VIKQDTWSQVGKGLSSGDRTPVVAPVLVLGAHPGGRCTTTANTPGLLSTGAMGMVSTHLVKEPHRCTCITAGVSGAYPRCSCKGGLPWTCCPTCRPPNRHTKRVGTKKDITTAAPVVYRARLLRYQPWGRHIACNMDSPSAAQIYPVNTQPASLRRQPRTDSNVFCIETRKWGCEDPAADVHACGGSRCGSKELKKRRPIFASPNCCLHCDDARAGQGVPDEGMLAKLTRQRVCEECSPHAGLGVRPLFRQQHPLCCWDCV
jgi:hypothetical protein